MNNTVVLDGELNLIMPGEAECELTTVQDGEVGLVTVAGSYPPYQGETTITPSNEQQILQTAMKSVLTNIVINPIPNNYGLITWDGTKITVS